MKKYFCSAIALVVAVLTFSATAAHADQGPRERLRAILDSLVEPCDQTGITQRFLDWGDDAYYVPAPGGSFEDADAGWELEPGASFVAGGNPFGTDGQAVAIESGATVTSPPICVGPDYTVSRMFAETAGRGPLKVEVLYPHAVHGKEKAKISTLSPVDEWGPTEQWKMPRLHQISLVNKLRGTDDQIEVRFRFTAKGNSDWTIDDVWVDPRMRR